MYCIIAVLRTVIFWPRTSLRVPSGCVVASPSISYHLYENRFFFPSLGEGRWIKVVILLLVCRTAIHGQLSRKTRNFDPGTTLYSSCLQVAMSKAGGKIARAPVGRHIATSPHVSQVLYIGPGYPDNKTRSPSSQQGASMSHPLRLFNFLFLFHVHTATSLLPLPCAQHRRCGLCILISAPLTHSISDI